VKDQVFLSHSRKDRQIVQYFVDKFDDTGIKPVLMEFEKWSRNRRPNWQWIKDEIKESKALFLLLSRNITRKQQTQNWVSFEIGLASMCIPPIPVFVFEEEEVYFPIPYLSHYFDQSFSKKTGLFTKDFSETLLNAFIHVTYESFIDVVIKDPSISLSPDETIECARCLIRFHYWGTKESILCPCCSSSIKIFGPNVKNIFKT
jgi:hypothetical protein